MSLTTLFIDLNAYFASCEQQLRPELRGKPVAVVPIDAPSACCIAASYEAKRVGVKTGMIVDEARRFCPNLVLALARPESYVRFHHQILAAVDTCLPVEKVFSIDEFSCRLMKGERDPARAVELARRVKAAIKGLVGECMRCSVGIAPNRFLAKVGTDMQKPDGLVVIEEKDLPHKLFSLKPIDLPGIGPRMEQRLLAKGISTVEQLCSLSELELEKVWESVVGRRWWHWLRGRELDEYATHRRSIGHQHVLPPEYRNEEGARAVAVRLLHKAAARARALGYLAQRLSLVVGVDDHRTGRWSSRGDEAHLDGGTADTLALVQALGRLWANRPKGHPKFIAVTLLDLIPEPACTAPLFETERHRAGLFKAIDRLNKKHGKNTVYSASMHHAKSSAPGGIAFHVIPDLDLPDTVTDRMK